MSSPPSQLIADFHSPAQGGVATSQDVATALTVVFKDIEAALAPIIGVRGVAALYRRSVHVVCEAHPWLAPARGDDAQPMNLGPLASVTAAQSPQRAAAAAEALLNHFHELLASLIGASLTQRLLRTTWVPVLRGAPQDDPS